MSWLRKPPSTRSIRMGARGILTMPADLTDEEAAEAARRFQQAYRTAHAIVLAPGMNYTPLRPRKRKIRLAAAERWLNA